MPPNLAVAAHARDLFVTPQAVLLWQHLRSQPDMVVLLLLASAALDCAVALGAVTIPVSALYVIVHFDSKTAASATTAPLQHLTPALGLHTSTETMPPHPTSLFRLVCTLWHSIISQKNKGLSPIRLSLFT
jgi:hypothetical protein